jgi:hypothetical protein
MRSVSVRARGVALLLLLVLTAVPVLADEPPPGTEPPQARIHVPIGVSSAEETEELGLLDLFLIWLQHRIHVPIG